MNTVSESKSILLDGNRAAFLIAATVKLLSKISVTDPPAMLCVPSPLPTNYLLTDIPGAVYLHSRMSQSLMPQHAARMEELGSDMNLTQDDRELTTYFFPLYNSHI